jgi:hypothetical protein
MGKSISGNFPQSRRAERHNAVFEGSASRRDRIDMHAVMAETRNTSPGYKIKIRGADHQKLHLSPPD